MEFDYRRKLENTYRDKKLRNPAYSLRAYSRDIGISLTALSEVLSYKRNFSDKNAFIVSRYLCFSEEEKNMMLSEIKNLDKNSQDQSKIQQIKEDEFQLLSNWYYFAILTLSKQKNINAAPKTLAKRFGIRPEQVSEALKILKRLNLLKVKNKKLERTSLSLRTTTDIPSYAIKNYHIQNLQVATHNILHTPVELREVISMNLNIDPTKMQLAKKMIREFKEKFTQKMEKTSPKEIYSLAICFFPTTLSKEEYDV